MEGGEERINCNIFQKQEPVIKRLTDSVNTAKDIRRKIPQAERLLKEVNNLLDCPDYKEKDTDCSNCHFISNIRRQTAEVIIKAKKLTKKGNTFIKINRRPIWMSKMFIS